MSHLVPWEKYQQMLSAINNHMCPCNPNFTERGKWHCLEIYAGVGFFFFFPPPLQSIFEDDKVNLKMRQVQLERKCHFPWRIEVVILPWVLLSSRHPYFHFQSLYICDWSHEGHCSRHTGSRAICLIWLMGLFWEIMAWRRHFLPVLSEGITSCLPSTISV